MLESFDYSEVLRKEFEGASDRASAVVAGAFLDELLSELLREFFVKDPANDKKIFEGTGPLATFSAKIDVAYRAGLISPNEHRIIHTVRSIRNDFAHDLDAKSFSDQSIAARCKNIETPIEMVGPKSVPLSQKGEVPPLPEITKADSGNSRACFQESIITLLHVLGARVVDAGHSRRTSPTDFSAAHEPAERVAERLKNVLQRYQDLIRTKELTSDERNDAEAALRKHQLLVRVQEFCIQQIKAAHEVRLHKGYPCSRPDAV